MYRIGDKAVLLKDMPRSLWPIPGQDNQLLKGTEVTLRRLPSKAPFDMVWVSIGDEVDPFGDNWIAVNVKDMG